MEADTKEMAQIPGRIEQFERIKYNTAKGALYTALNAMGAGNRLILTEKYYTKNHQSNSDYKIAALKNMPVSHYRAMLREAQEEVCIFFGPLDQQIDAEYEERLQQERENRIQKRVDHIAKRWSC